MKLESKNKWILIGDSITDCGRDRNAVGFTPRGNDAYGGGYVGLLRAMLCSKYPELDLRLMNKGNSGDNVLSLEARWQEDVLDHKPDWLSVMIGINDVWRQFDGPQNPVRVPIDLYETTYRNLLARTRPSLQGLIIAGPYFIEPNRQEPMRAMMEQYAAVAQKLAGEFDAIWVDTQAAFDRYLEYHHPSELAWDRVHPSAIGHGVITNAIMDAIEA